MILLAVLVVAGLAVGLVVGLALANRETPALPLRIEPPAPVRVAPSPVVRVTAAPVVRVEPSAPQPALAVAPPPRGAWQERGWEQGEERGQTMYTGDYQVRERAAGVPRSFRGRVILQGGKAEAYIADPPPEAARHAKWTCFHQVGGPWYHVNWRTPARNVDEAILYLEMILDEAINR